MALPMPRPFGAQNRKQETLMASDLTRGYSVTSGYIPFWYVDSDRGRRRGGLARLVVKTNARWTLAPTS